MKKFCACVLVLFFSMMFVAGPLCAPVLAETEGQDTKNAALALVLLLLLVGVFTLTETPSRPPAPVVVPPGAVSQIPAGMPGDPLGARATPAAPALRIPGTGTQLSLSGQEVAIRF